MVIEALADGAVKQGIPRKMAIQFASQTVLGAAKMVLHSGKHPAVLRDEVIILANRRIIYSYVHVIAVNGIYYMLFRFSPVTL